MAIREQRRKPEKIGPLNRGWVEDFWSKIDKSGGDDACWPWKARGHSVRGMPRTRLMGRRLYCSCRRVVMFLTTGEEPRSSHIWVSCGNVVCLNPKHLLVGEVDARTKEKFQAVAKTTRRTLRGEGHFRAKLKNSDIPKIRQMIKLGYKLKVIGDRFGVDEGIISHIKTGRAWGHIPLTSGTEPELVDGAQNLDQYLGFLSLPGL